MRLTSRCETNCERCRGLEFNPPQEIIDAAFEPGIRVPDDLHGEAFEAWLNDRIAEHLARQAKGPS